MKKLLILLTMVSLVVISGCYRPNWYRANTTYAELRAESEWCKGQTNIGATREEMIDQYERCMQGKGYQLKARDPYSGEPTIRVEQKEGPIVIDKRAKVYVGIYSGSGVSGRYFHKADCRHIRFVSTKETTVGEAIASGKSMCPDCFRD
jgi:hypothetical protein